MSRSFNREFLIEVAKGNVPGHSLIHKFGGNDAVPNGGWAHISLLPFDSVTAGAADFRTSPSTVRIKAGGNAQDRQNGTGARKVTVQGIDDSFNEVTEELDPHATDGTLAGVTGSTSFWRIHRAWVSSSGTYGDANTGQVIIEDGTNDLISIAAEAGQSLYGGWTVPVGKTTYLLSVYITVDSGKTVNVQMLTRQDIDDSTAPVKAPRVQRFWTGLSGKHDFIPVSPNSPTPEKSDIWFEAYGDGAVAAVTVEFELLVVDD